MIAHKECHRVSCEQFHKGFCIGEPLAECDGRLILVSSETFKTGIESCLYERDDLICYRSKGHRGFHYNGWSTWQSPVEEITA